MASYSVPFTITDDARLLFLKEIDGRNRTWGRLAEKFPLRSPSHLQDRYHHALKSPGPARSAALSLILELTSGETYRPFTLADLIKLSPQTGPKRIRLTLTPPKGPRRITLTQPKGPRRIRLTLSHGPRRIILTSPKPPTTSAAGPKKIRLILNPPRTPTHDMAEQAIKKESD